MQTKNITIAFFEAYNKQSAEIFINNENEAEIRARLKKICDTYFLISVIEFDFIPDAWSAGAKINTDIKCIFNESR